MTGRAKRRRWWFVAAGVIALIAAIGAVGWFRHRPPRPNVILVTFDTTRADHLGAYGYPSGRTAGFDDWAAQGVVFDHAYAPAPITLPSHATMLTGLYPPEHGLRVNGSGQLSRDLPLLPAILKEQGYDTGAFIAAVVLDSMYGLDRGFDVYNDDIPRSDRHFGERRRDGQQVVDAALDWLRGRKSPGPFFCWIHLFDAHAPYDPRTETYGDEFVEDPYDAGVAWEVEQFARLRAYLEEQHLDDNTLIVVAGDHGEGLGDHGETEHGMLVYNSTLRVPLAFIGPTRFRPGTRVAEGVSLVDLMPTLLDVLELPIPEPCSGRSLLPALQGEALEPQDCYAEADTPYVMNGWSPLRTVMTDRWKYIQTTRPELYDLQEDPGELNNLADSNADQLTRMKSLLADMEDSFVHVVAEEAGLSEKDRANLEALGYVAGGHTVPTDEAQTLPDVKDMLPFLATFEDAKYLSIAGHPDQAIPLLQQIVRQTNDFPAANLLLADVLAQAGRLDDAVATYRSLLERRPDYTRAHYSLGRLLAGQQQWDEAESRFRQVIEQTPDAAAAHFELAQVLVQRQQFDEAVREYNEALRYAPDLVPAHVSLGQLLTMLRRPQEAVRSFQTALRYEPGNPSALANLMSLLAQMGDLQSAQRYGERAVQAAPDSFENRFNLGLIYIAQRRFADGIAQLRAAQTLRPEDPRPAQQIEQAEAAMRK